MFSEMFKQNPKMSAGVDITTSCEADKDILEHAMLELQTFARTNLMELSRMEKRRTGAPSTSMDIFCRIDIGIMQTEDGRVNYFVNEVERGPNVSLWAGDDWPHLIGEVASKFGPLLHTWIRESR
jgi:hypothetical protein